MNEVIYLSKNLQYFRRETGLGPNELADIFAVDPLDIYELERRNDFVEDDKVAILLTGLCDHFGVEAGDMVYEDLEGSGLVTSELLEQLRQERSEGIPINRQAFNEKMAAEVIEGSTNGSRLYVLKKALNVIQRLNQIQTAYNKERAKRTIDQMGIFENPD